MLNFNFKNFKIVSVNKVSLSVNIVCTCDLHLWKREGSGGVLKLKNLLHVRRERKTGHCKTWPWLGIFFFLTQWGCWKGGKTCTCDKLLLGYMSCHCFQWKRRLSSRSWKSSPQVLFIYEVLWLSRSTSQSALPAWLICFGEASALRSVSGHKGPAKQLDGSSGYTVRILNGFSEMKGSVHLTEIKLFVLSFKQPTYAVENLQRKSQTLWVVIAVRFSFLIHIFRSCSTSYQV